MEASTTRILFLDDNEHRCASFRSWLPATEISATAQGMIDLLKKGEPVWHLFLDHDLGNETFVDSNRPDCGMEVVRWIVANKPAIDHITVHTLNPSAAQEMVAKLRKAGYDVDRVPFTKLLEAINYAKGT